MSHFCEFCQVQHSSTSCFHPGQAKLAALESENARLKAELARVQTDYDKEASDLSSAVNAELDSAHAELARVKDALKMIAGKAETAMEGAGMPEFGIFDDIAFTARAALEKK